MCPICQNTLKGEGCEDYWPKENKLRQQAFWYRLQLFIALSLTLVGLVLDFTLSLHGQKHWSLIVALWVVIGELVFDHYLHRMIILANLLTKCAFYVAVLLFITGWYLGFRTVVVYVVIPIMVSALLIANLVFALIDKKGNALIYLIMNILVGLVSSAVLLVLRRQAIVWTICFMISAVTFIGVAVFLGRKLTLELQKRMNI